MLSIAFNFFKNNRQFFIPAAVFILIGILSYSYQDNKRKLVKARQLNEQKDSLITVLKYDLKVVISDRDSCRSEQKKVILLNKKADKEATEKIIAFRESIKNLTTEQKQQKLLQKAKIVVQKQNVFIHDTTTINDSITVALGTVNFKGKEIPYYTSDQQDLLLWAVEEAGILQENREETANAGNTYNVIISSVGNQIITVIDEEIKDRHFLGIGQKRDLKKLKTDLQIIFNRYKIKT